MAIDPTKNPTSKPVKTDQDERNSTDPLDVRDAMNLMRKIQELTIWYAKIKKKSDEFFDEYTALIFHTKTDNEDAASYREIKIYEPDSANRYEINAWVEVVLDSNMIGLIVPRRLPKGTGRCKALLLIDDSNPGTPDWDYWRFQE